MTELEIVLIGIIWVAYGYLHAWQLYKVHGSIDSKFWGYVFSIITAPIVVVWRICLGLFHMNTLK